ncbi:hypothetical protein HB364_20665 [Pseudoflavitalea sp. X16]|uniref:hypothetical protein n=1 Tax=Paraflavitalea devenefica TaxID=2716334 RepID=UPI00141DEA1F|nr:hypothetical protein [Paraflavitalea devenefica]NII27513.1 hypothetical protein [Paraflavitalea devenefica]
MLKLIQKIRSNNYMVKKALAWFAKSSWWLQWLIISMLALVLFAPIIGNSFVSDDFSVLKKVCIDRQLNINGFFRPLSDITLFINYLVGGFNPAGYYLTNILLHALDVLLLFHFCRRWQWTPDTHKQLLFAGIAALLFLTYPFHSEPVVWILGRACLLANTFGMLALVIMVSTWKEPYKIAGVAACYFVGMTGYESVMILPAMVFVWLLAGKAALRRHIIWMLTLGLTLSAHFIIRVKASGGVTGEYGASLLSTDPLKVLTGVVKTSGRFFLPPMEQGKLMTLLFIIVAGALLFLLFKLWKRIRADRQAVYFLLSQLAFFLLASLIPFLISVSTHTSENDRFLHLPSFFLCAIMAFVIVTFFYQKNALLWVVAGLTLYQVICLQLTLMNWRKASAAVVSILDRLKNREQGRNIYIINLPEETEGAYIFRVGFREALILRNIDTAGVIVINRAKRDTLVQWPGILQPGKVKQGIFIPPSTYIQQQADGGTTIGEMNRPGIPVPPNSVIIYWNKQEWIAL